MQTFAHELYSGKLFPDGTADSGFSPPLCFVENPLTAMLVSTHSASIPPTRAQSIAPIFPSTFYPPNIMNTEIIYAYTCSRAAAEGGQTVCLLGWLV
jgi:hypothetical protein